MTWPAWSNLLALFLLACGLYYGALYGATKRWSGFVILPLLLISLVAFVGLFGLAWAGYGNG